MGKKLSLITAQQYCYQYWPKVQKAFLTHLTVIWSTCNLQSRNSLHFKPISKHSLALVWSSVIIQDNRHWWAPLPPKDVSTTNVRVEIQNALTCIFICLVCPVTAKNLHISYERIKQQIQWLKFEHNNSINRHPRNKPINYIIEEQKSRSEPSVVQSSEESPRLTTAFTDIWDIFWKQCDKQLWS